MRDDWATIDAPCPKCGCRGMKNEDGLCIHCGDPTHMATHRQHNYDHSHGFVQWKGTTVCMDFYCTKCGYQDHIDDTFVYFIKCAACGTTYMTGWYVDMVELTEEEALGTADSGSLKVLNQSENEEC